MPMPEDPHPYPGETNEEFERRLADFNRRGSGTAVFWLPFAFVLAIYIGWALTKLT